MRSHIRLAGCLWLQGIVARNPLFEPVTKALEARGVKPYSLPHKSDRNGWDALKDLLNKDGRHVVLHGLSADELKPLQPLFAKRKNFSMLLVDWWISPFWFTQNAEYLLFHLYNGIAIRTRPITFANDWQPPLLTWPEEFVPYHLAGAALRPAALLAQPFLDGRNRRWRNADIIHPERLIYFPIPISRDNLPFQDEKSEYDFCNTGSTTGFWLMRDPYAPAKYNFADLYSDRKRLVNLILKLEGKPYKIFDRRRFRGRLAWETYCCSIRRSRFAISTGGLHQASVPKYLEYACFGTPMIGSTLPYEFPWLDQCLFPIDGLRVTPEELPEKLKEAFALQPKLRQNCLELRDTLLRMYDPVRLFDMAQDQMDGQPVPPGYLKVDLKQKSIPIQ
jgi:hypothetical protein